MKQLSQYHFFYIMQKAPWERRCWEEKELSGLGWDNGEFLISRVTGASLDPWLTSQQSLSLSVE